MAPIETVIIVPRCGVRKNEKNNSALDDMSMVERREFFEPEPEDYRLEDEERHLRFDLVPI